MILYGTMKIIQHLLGWMQFHHKRICTTGQSNTCTQHLSFTLNIHTLYLLLQIDSSVHFLQDALQDRGAREHRPKSHSTRVWKEIVSLCCTASKSWNTLSDSIEGVPSRHTLYGSWPASQRQSLLEVKVASSTSYEQTSKNKNWQKEHRAFHKVKSCIHTSSAIYIVIIKGSSFHSEEGPVRIDSVKHFFILVAVPKAENQKI